jgi:hypothetical protein
MNTDDLNFAYKLRHALNERLDDLPAATTDRLAAARRAALARKKPEAPAGWLQRVFAGAHDGRGTVWAGRMSVAVPLLATAIGLASLYQYEQKQHIAELAEIDAAVLSDELPLTAYLDQGFDAYASEAPPAEKRAQ